MKQNGFYRNAQKFNREAMQTAKKYAAIDKEKSLEDGKNRLANIKKKNNADLILFCDLQAGDNLAAFGRPDMIVEKKNIKTIKSQGILWSLVELQNL